MVNFERNDSRGCFRHNILNLEWSWQGKRILVPGHFIETYYRTYGAELCRRQEI